MRMLLVLGIFLSGCTTIPDVEICTDLNSQKGFCTMTISKKERFVENEEWLSLKRNSLVLPADSWVKLKSYLLKNCRQHKDCGKNIGLWEHKIKSLDNVKVK